MSVSTLGERLGITKGAAAAIVTIVAVGVAVSLLPPLIALNLSARGISERTIGLLASTLAISALFATPFAPRIAARFGTANVIATLTPLAALLIPFVWLIENIVYLFPIVFLYGGAISLCFTLSEYWINAATPGHRRGFVMGLYATLLSLGFAIGPAIISALGAHSIAPFMIGSVLMALSAIPAILARTVSPNIGATSGHRFAVFIFAVPVATLGAFAFALGESGGFAFLPLWGQHLGFGSATVPLLASAMTLGNVAFQIPLGALADRMDRRHLLLACGIVGAVGMVIAWRVSHSAPLLMLVLFVWGGATAGIYTIGLAHLASRFSADDLVGANAAFVFCYALGMLLGPFTIGDAMTRAPLTGFPLVAGTVFALYSLIVLARIVGFRRLA